MSTTAIGISFDEYYADLMRTYTLLEEMVDNYVDQCKKPWFIEQIQPLVPTTSQKNVKKIVSVVLEKLKTEIQNTEGYRALIDKYPFLAKEYEERLQGRLRQMHSLYPKVIFLRLKKANP